MKKKYKGRKYVVYNFKGGQGKTSISIELALELGFGIVTNDIITELEAIFPKELLLKLEPDQPLPSAKDFDGADIIFDFGGFIDSRVIPALEMSEYVLIPLVDIDKLNKDAFVKTLVAVSAHNKNIIIILNKMPEKGKELVKEETKRLNLTYPIFEIKNNGALKIVMEEGRPISEIVKDSALRKYFYHSTELQFQEIIKYITKGEK